MLLPLLAFLSSWLTPTSVASRNLVTCTTSHFMTKQMSQRPSPSRLLCMGVCVRERARECRGVKHDQKQKSTPCKRDPFYGCVNELHGSESAFSFTFIPLGKPCLWQWRNPLPSLRFLSVATVSPPLKSVEEVRGRKPKLSSQFRSVSCLHPRCLPLPSTQTSSNVLRNFKNKVTEISREKSKKINRKGRKGRPSSSSISFCVHPLQCVIRRGVGPLEAESSQHQTHTNVLRHTFRPMHKHDADTHAYQTPTALEIMIASTTHGPSCHVRCIIIKTCSRPPLNFPKQGVLLK